MKLELNKVYKDRTGRQWKVDRNKRYPLIYKWIIIDQYMEGMLFVSDDGKKDNSTENDSDLIELVGDNFVELDEKSKSRWK